MYKATVVADSIASGSRLTTLEVTFPRYILAEFNTHRVFSRNSASSRAIPVKTRVQQVRDNPFVPEFTRNKPGMQADDVLIDDDARNAEALWRGSAQQMAKNAESLAHIDVHKQQANRLLEAFVWHTVLVTATYWDNFWGLRVHKDASPEMFKTAKAMKEAMEASAPKELRVGEWHLPLVPDVGEILEEEERRGWTTVDHNLLARVSVARCAAVSYERQHIQKNLDEYVMRHDAMKLSGHWSPFEHQAKVATFEEIRQHAYFKVEAGNLALFPDGRVAITDGRLVPVCIGNFAVPWFQYRKMIPGEDVFRSDPK